MIYILNILYMKYTYKISVNKINLYLNEILNNNYY